MIPNAGTSLLIALVFVVPGSVVQFTRTRLRGPIPDDSSATRAVIRVLSASTALTAAYLVVVGPYLGHLVVRAGHQVRDGQPPTHVRELGAWGALLLFAVPALVAAGDHLRISRGRGFRFAYDPTPRALDFAFRGRGPCYVRVLTTTNTWLGGYFGSDSFISSYPEPREIFLESAYRMNTDGTFGIQQPRTGIYIRCDDARSIEVIELDRSTAAATETPAETEPAAAPTETEESPPS